MANVIWLLSGARLLREVREACRMSQPQFAKALGEELGWTPPTGVVRAWEETNRDLPDEVDRAVRRVGARGHHRTEPRRGPNRREFLDSAARLGGLAVLGPAVSGRTERVGSVPMEPRSNYPSEISTVGLLNLSSVGEEGISFLWELLASYRSAYGMTSAEFLLPRLGGLVPVLLDMERSGSASPFKTRITSLLGQAAVMAGVLALMGRHDLAQARDYYELASAAGQASADGDLFLYAQGSMSFRDVRAGRLRDAVQRISAARDAAPGPASPTTLSWLASLGSELHARDGDESMSMRLIDEAERLCEEESHPGSWRGVGMFDQTKVLGYRGGNLVLLNRGREAEEVLTTALNRLEMTRVKHRCTALGDLALALALQKEPDEAARKGMEALEMARQLRHSESELRVRRVYARLRRWQDRPTVRQLGEHLGEAI
jgi:hypothetical protein